MKSSGDGWRFLVYECDGPGGARKPNAVTSIISVGPNDDIAYHESLVAELKRRKADGLPIRCRNYDGSGYTLAYLNPTVHHVIEFLPRLGLDQRLTRQFYF